jgi:hypothetical protein
MREKEKNRLAGFAAAVLVGLAAAAPALAEQKSLLTPDGTVFTVQSGPYGVLEPQGTAANPTDYVIEWRSTTQNGLTQSGLIPGTNSSDVKDQFDLAYDSYSRSLFLVWNDRFMLLNNIQFAVLQNGIWTQSQLLPSGVFTFASNPKILITHQVIQTADANGIETDYPRSIVSIVWWEDSVHPRARYAPIFIEHDGIDLSAVQIYDLPDFIGSPEADSNPVFNHEIYKNPALQSDGLTSMILATFADAATGKLQTLHLNFPTDLRSMGGSPTAQGRGHVIVIFNHHTWPLPGSVPPDPDRIGTVLGGNYRPTLFWQNDDGSLQFSSYGDQGWSDPRTVPLSPALDAEKAIMLIRAMALQN